MEECCGTCVFHRKEENGFGWVCTNPYAEAYGLDTEYSDDCLDYQENENYNVDSFRRY